MPPREGASDSTDFSPASTAATFQVGGGGGYLQALAEEPGRGMAVEELEVLLREVTGEELQEEEVAVVVAAARELADSSGFVPLDLLANLLLDNKASEDKKGLADTFSDMMNIMGKKK